MTFRQQLALSALMIVVMTLGFWAGYGSALVDAQQVCVAGMHDGPIDIGEPDGTPTDSVPPKVWCEHLVRDQHGDSLPARVWKP